MDAIRVERLTKKYKDVVAVDNLNLSVRRDMERAVLAGDAYAADFIVHIIGKIALTNPLV